MRILGSYDRTVGIIYNLLQSKKLNKDLWNTDDEFTFYIGPITNNKYVTVPKNYLTDGATVPRPFWVIFPPWGVYGQAAVLHDYLCNTRELTKNGDNTNLVLQTKQIDVIFKHAMKVAGTPWWKRTIIYSAVRIYHIFSL